MRADGDRLIFARAAPVSKVLNAAITLDAQVDVSRGWSLDDPTHPDTEDAMIQPHQPDQAVFRSVLPEDVDWKPFPAFPPSVRLAVLVGQPSEPGPYLIRVKVPAGVKLMPHRHPEDRIYTVMSGVFYIGLGEQFDGSKVEAYPPGSIVVLPGDTWHFHWAKSGEYHPGDGDWPARSRISRPA